MGALPSSTLSASDGYISSLLDHEVSVIPRRSFVDSSEEGYIFERSSDVPILRSVPPVVTSSIYSVSLQFQSTHLESSILSESSHSPPPTPLTPPPPPPPRGPDPNEGYHLYEPERQLSHYSTIASELLPWLYLSGELPPCNKETIERLGIKVIVNCAGEIVPNAFEGVQYDSIHQISYLTLCLRDGPFEDVFSLFYRVIRAIEAARRDGGAALIHCHQGVSRSATFAIAYLMWAGGLSFSCAYSYTRTIREIVSPNAGFMCQLVEWEAHLRSLSNLLQPIEEEDSRQTMAFPIMFRLSKLFDGCYESGRLICNTPKGLSDSTDNRTYKQPIEMCLQLVRSSENRSLLPATSEFVKTFDQDILIVLTGVDIRDGKRVNSDQNITQGLIQSRRQGNDNIGIEAFAVIGSKFVDTPLKIDTGLISSIRDENFKTLPGTEDTGGLRNDLRSLVREMALWGTLVVQPQGLIETVLEYMSSSSIRKNGIVKGLMPVMDDINSNHHDSLESLKSILGVACIYPPTCGIHWQLAQDVVFVTASNAEGKQSQTEMNFFHLLEERCRGVDDVSQRAIQSEISERQRENLFRYSDTDIVRSPAVELSPRSRHALTLEQCMDETVFETEQQTTVPPKTLNPSSELADKTTNMGLSRKNNVPVLKLHFVKK